MEGVTMKSIKYDKEEFQDLVNSVTPLQAVEWLLMNGYPILVRNLGKSTVDILCPSPDHNDTNFGNCKISTNRYDGRAGSRCHCYCCNMSYDSYDILKQFLSYRQSIEALIEISGKVDYYQSSKKIKKKKDPVAKETKELLGLATYPSFNLVKNCTFEEPSGCYFRKCENGSYLIMEQPKWNPWIDLDLETRQWILREKSKEKMIQIGRLARQLTGSEFVSTDTQEIFQYFDQYGRNELLRELDGIFRECQKVYRRNGGKIHNSQELINSQSVLA